MPEEIAVAPTETKNDNDLANESMTTAFNDARAANYSTEEKENFMSIFSEELAANEKLRSFNNVNELATAYLEAKGGLDGDSTQKIISDPSEYVWQPPDGVEVNLEIDSEFRKTALESGLSQEQFKSLQDFAFKISAPLEEKAIAKAIEEDRVQNHKTLKEQWGDDFDSKLEKARFAVTKKWGDTGLDHAESLGIADDAKFIGLMAELGESMTEDTLKSGEAVMSKDSIKSRIDTLMGDFKGPYHDSSHANHTSTVEEVNNLYALLYK